MGLKWGHLQNCSLDIFVYLKSGAYLILNTNPAFAGGSMVMESFSAEINLNVM